ncbi:MAG TPA: TetR/AcrR family transcriptional regulator [Bryobacteraceae bacterium]|nr:TetR/AcrR family transcriptional regulator [Bryobacteraceae bacterium]
MEAARARVPAPPTASAEPPIPASNRTTRMPGEDRRRQLLRVAVDSFARNGFSGTKTKDIAAAAGVSEAILFRHFASKEDLYHAILDEKEATMGGDRWFVEMNELAERRDDRGLFRHVARQIIRSFREDAAFHRLLLYASLEGHLLADLFHERFGLPMGDFLARYVAQRQCEGAFRECSPGVAVMFLIGSTVHYAMARYVMGVKKFPPEEEDIVEQFVELTLSGLERQAGLERKPGVERHAGPERRPSSRPIAKGKRK